MINIIKEKLEIDETLKRRLEIICDFCNTTPTIINGSIRKVDKTNGMEKQVGKSDVFTKESLRKLQDKMRILCIEFLIKNIN